MCDCDCEPPDFYEEVMFRARKQHKCCECRLPILPGEYYHYAAGKWDGDFMAFKTCLACKVIWTSCVQLGSCQCFGELRSEINEIDRYWERPWQPSPAQLAMMQAR